MDRIHNYVVTLLPNGDEPVNVQEALMKVHHFNQDHHACFTPDGIGYASKWRYPKPEELRVWLRSNGNFRVHLELHTQTVKGHEIITFRGTSERFFWSEVMTHRNSRNASSARAIPYKKMKTWIMNDPAMPIHFGSNRAGMQSGNTITDVDGCEKEILELLDEVYRRMDGIVTKYDIHKEIINRYSEPWAWINWVASFSRPAFHNMLNLRCNPHAHPSFQRLSSNMARQYRASSPEPLAPGQWHMPFVSDICNPNSGNYMAPSLQWMDQKDLDHLLRWSVARSAWTSYQTVEEKIATDAEAYKRHDDCVNLKHATPCEHANRARDDGGRNGGTMPGYDQYRHMIPNESCSNFDFDKFEETYQGRDFVIL
jgi:hypothetical protein